MTMKNTTKILAACLAAMALASSAHADFNFNSDGLMGAATQTAKTGSWFVHPLLGAGVNLFLGYQDGMREKYQEMGISQNRRDVDRLGKDYADRFYPVSDDDWRTRLPQGKGGLGY